MFFLVLIIAFVGFLVGLTGIGGILAIPAIIVFADAPAHVAMGTALSSFFLVGLVGTANFKAMGVLNRKEWLPLCLGGLPCAFIGAKFNNILPASVLLFLLGCIIILAGVSALRPWKALKGLNVTDSEHAPKVIAAVGAVSGLIAGMTGAGGPVLSIPMLISFGMAPFAAVVTGMPFQITTSIAGSAGNLLNGNIDPELLAWIVVPIVLGLVIGNRVAPHIPSQMLKRGIGVLCLCIGVYQCLRAVYP